MHSAVIAITIISILSTVCNSIALSAVLTRCQRFRFINVVLRNIFFSSLIRGALFYTAVYIKNDMHCKVNSFLIRWMAVATINHIFILVAHRYIQVMLPFKARELNKQTRPAWLCAFSAWIVGLTISLPPLLGWGGYTRANVRHWCGMDYNNRSVSSKSYAVFALMLSFVPVKLACYAFTKVMCMKGIFRRIQYCRFILMEILMLVTLIVSWTPYAALGAMSIFAYDVQESTKTVCTLLTKSCTILQSLVYIFAYRLYRNFACCRQPSKTRVKVRLLSSRLSSRISLSRRTTAFVKESFL